MDHSGHDGMNMDPTTTTGSVSATSTPEASMDHGGMGNGCKISMLLNYNTIDSCFISENWKVTSTGMFAGSCIGIVCLAIFLEFLRRSVKEWDSYLVKQHVAQYTTGAVAAAAGAAPGSASPTAETSSAGKGASASAASCGAAIPPFRPKLWQQAVRSFLHTAQFTVAYFIMLLAMYYNVYVLVSIFLGILVGNLILGFETLHPGGQQNLFNKEPTVCCG